MVEAMHENSHDYFKQYQKHFRYFTTDSKPNFSKLKDNVNYCIGFHPSHLKLEDCSLKGNHYHIICDKEIDFFNAGSSIPCLVNCFYFLLKPTVGVTVVGEKLIQLQNAVITIPKLDPKVFSFRIQQRNLPLSKSTANESTTLKRHLDETSSELPAATSKRLKRILESQYANDFYKIMDLFSSGEGVFDKSCNLFSIKLKLNKLDNETKI